MKNSKVIIPFVVLLAFGSCRRVDKMDVVARSDVGTRHQITAVRTDHGGNASDISTDEIYLELKDGSKEYLTDNSLMDRVPTFSPDNALVAFLRRRDSNADGKVNWDDNCELWLMQLAGRQSKCITEGMPDAGMHSWHPLAQQIAFVAGEQVNDKTLYVYDVAQGTRRKICDGASSWPTWSPDGAYIAFYGKRNRVTVTTPDGDWSKSLSDDVGNGWALYWTHDSRLIFTHEKLARQIFSPKKQKVRPLENEELARLKLVDQKRYNWARQGAQPGVAADADKRRRWTSSFSASVGPAHRALQVEDRLVQGAVLASAINPLPRHVHPVSAPERRKTQRAGGPGPPGPGGADEETIWPRGCVHDHAPSVDEQTIQA